MSNFKHGLRNTGSYKTWRSVISRCKYPKEKDIKNYINRGITVCERWLKFENFYADMGDRPEGKSIERIDNNAGYTPDNCKWATRSEQERNKSTTRHLTYKGETKLLMEWADEKGIIPRTLHNRIFRDKMTVEEALDRPLKYAAYKKHSKKRRYMEGVNT